MATTDRGAEFQATCKTGETGCVKNRPDEMMTAASPCVRSCTLDSTTETCVGCGRTLTEILNWRRYSDGERNSIIEELPKRLQSLQTNGRASLITTPSGTPPDLSEIISRSFGTLAAGGSTKHR